MMKIDIECINHNAIRLIKELIDSRYGMLCGKDNSLIEERGYLLMTLGEISGVLEMAEAMKEVLKA